MRRAQDTLARHRLGRARGEIFLRGHRLTFDRRAPDLDAGEIRRLLDPGPWRRQPPQVRVRLRADRAAYRLVVDVDDLDSRKQQFSAVSVRIADIGIIGMLMPAGGGAML